MVPITDEEKASPLYKYFTRPMVDAPAEKYAKAEQPMDPADALSPFEMNKLFDPGYLPGEIGYCNLPDGGGTLANLTPMPGVTPEMFDFWFAWHGCQPMRYKIWNPDQHYYCLTRNLDRALDTSLTLKERYWNTTHDVKEDVGMGPEDIVINFRYPVDIGFDEQRYKNFKGTIVCAGNAESPTIMVHFVRPTDDGVELRTRFWMGYSVIDGKPKCIIPPGHKMPLQPVKALLTHNMKEFTNLAAILPEVYAEFHDDFVK